MTTSISASTFTEVEAAAVRHLGTVGGPPPYAMRWPRPRTKPSPHNSLVSRREIDEYLEKLDEPKRATLRELRDTIMSVVPEAEECISYGMPAFRMHGTVVAGFAAFKNHLSYLPHSGSVLSQLQAELSPYEQTKGALRFPVDAPLPKALVAKLIEVRIRQAQTP